MTVTTGEIAEPGSAGPVAGALGAGAMGWGEAMVAALLATVDRPSWWLLSLAGFLVRGGIIVIALPMLVLPTIAQVSGLLGPSVVGDGLASPTSTLVAIAVGGVVAMAATLVVTNLVGGWIDAALVARMAADDDLEAGALAFTGAEPAVPAVLAATVRLVAHVPTLLVAVASGASLLQPLVNELLNETPTPGPLLVRVAAAVPVAIVAPAIAWLVGEACGGLAVRQLAAGRGVVRALWAGARRLASPSGLATFVVTDVAVLGAVSALWIVLGRAFDRVWPGLLDGDAPGSLAIPILLLAATWVATLWLVALATTWRSAAWTAESARHRRPTVTRTLRPPS